MSDVSDVSGPEIVVVHDPDAAADEAARRVGVALRDAAGRRGRADWAVTGGSTAVGIYRALATAPLRDEIPWESVHVWWGDDRFVPRDHPLSNVKPFDDILLAIGDRQAGTAGRIVSVPMGVDQVHPFPTSEAIGKGRGPDWCAERYAVELRLNGPAATPDGWPVFDLLTVGVGPDGHLLSVFPGSPALESSALALGIPAPTHVEPHVQRVTLNPAIVGTTRVVLAVVTGSEKAAVLAEIFGPERDPRRWPAQLALRPGATWILDAAAAAALPR